MKSSEKILRLMRESPSVSAAEIAEFRRDNSAREAAVALKLCKKRPGTLDHRRLRVLINSEYTDGVVINIAGLSY